MARFVRAPVALALVLAVGMSAASVNPATVKATQRTGDGSPALSWLDLASQRAGHLHAAAQRDRGHARLSTKVAMGA